MRRSLAQIRVSQKTSSANIKYPCLQGIYIYGCAWQPVSAGKTEASEDCSGHEGVGMMPDPKRQWKEA
jgi:hypothetical protein